MADLIARLEKATDWDRKLDVEIHCAVIGRDIGTIDLDGIGRPGSGWFPSAEWPPYTGSIDAALKLIPPPYKPGDRARIEIVYSENIGWSVTILYDHRGYGKSGAIAVSAAAMKARADAANYIQHEGKD
jgi:hypothetical protein